MGGRSRRPLLCYLPEKSLGARELIPSHTVRERNILSDVRRIGLLLSFLCFNVTDRILPQDLITLTQLVGEVSILRTRI